MPAEPCNSSVVPPPPPYVSLWTTTTAVDCNCTMAFRLARPISWRGRTGIF